MAKKSKLNQNVEDVNFASIDVECCKHCNFYRGDEKDGFSCNESPPAVFFNKDENDGTVEIIYAFPTPPETEWCGKFRRKVQ